MDDIDKLIAAVEAGVVSLYGSDKLFAIPKHESEPVRLFASKAYDGSLDAALRLHEALLPGWGWVLDEAVDGRDAHVYAPSGAHKSSGTADHIARAWLLAILRALKAKGAA